MLVLGRKEDESITVGDAHTAIVQLTHLEIELLKAINEPGLLGLCDRMLSSLGKPLEVMVTRIHTDHVRLGAIAPKDIPIHRKETYEAIKREGVRKS